jgi:hypothetical protein
VPYHSAHIDRQIGPCVLAPPSPIPQGQTLEPTKSGTGRYQKISLAQPCQSGAAGVLFRGLSSDLFRPARPIFRLLSVSRLSPQHSSDIEPSSLRTISLSLCHGDGLYSLAAAAAAAAAHAVEQPWRSAIVE